MVHILTLVFTATTLKQKVENATAIGVAKANAKHCDTKDERTDNLGLNKETVVFKPRPFSPFLENKGLGLKATPGQSKAPKTDGQVDGRQYDTHIICVYQRPRP
ncbi:MAG: hypothetical protein HOP36_09465 [Methyloglobulus sp.]|nr:hypothetical protein [Methyloglobulus sp.]